MRVIDAGAPQKTFSGSEGQPIEKDRKAEKQKSCLLGHTEVTSQ